jgi:hypothetical protein
MNDFFDYGLHRTTERFVDTLNEVANQDLANNPVRWATFRENNQIVIEVTLVVNGNEYVQKLSPRQLHHHLTVALKEHRYLKFRNTDSELAMLMKELDVFFHSLPWLLPPGSLCDNDLVDNDLVNDLPYDLVGFIDNLIANCSLATNLSFCSDSRLLEKKYGLSTIYGCSWVYLPSTLKWLQEKPVTWLGLLELVIYCSEVNKEKLFEEIAKMRARHRAEVNDFDLTKHPFYEQTISSYQQLNVTLNGKRLAAKYPVNEKYLQPENMGLSAKDFKSFKLSEDKCFFAHRHARQALLADIVARNDKEISDFCATAANCKLILDALAAAGASLFQPVHLYIGSHNVEVANALQADELKYYDYITSCGSEGCMLNEISSLYSNSSSITDKSLIADNIEDRFDWIRQTGIAACEGSIWQLFIQQVDDGLELIRAANG